MEQEWVQAQFGYGIGDGQQVGTVLGHASLWSGSAASWVDLNPAGASSSSARAISGGRQVGIADGHASLWSGSASSWVDLNPVGADGSEAWGISSDQQVGRIFLNGTYHASTWYGTAASCIDINPPGATESIANSIATHGFIAGTVKIDGVFRAGFWFNGTAGGWTDLHSSLPPGFSSSYASSITLGPGVTYVAGYGFDTLTGRYEALRWSIPAPPGAAALALAGVFATRRRR